jgi:hypothetical protein
MKLWCLSGTILDAQGDSVGLTRWGMRTLRSAFIALRSELVFVIQSESSSG